MSYFLTILFIASCTLVGVWGYRIWEITRHTSCSLLVKLSSPFIGLIILLTMVLIVTIGIVTSIGYLVGRIRDMIRTIPYHMISVFVSFILILNSKFKISPTIDNKSSAFWQWTIAVLNTRRQNYSDYPYIDKIGPIKIRDPHSHPMKMAYAYSSWHPFMLQKDSCKKSGEYSKVC